MAWKLLSSRVSAAAGRVFPDSLLRVWDQVKPETCGMEVDAHSVVVL